jgi:hypothetical protein
MDEFQSPDLIFLFIIILHIWNLISRYFLPEDGDHEDAPNVFLAPKPSRAGYPPLLRQVKGSFPLPGSYHFRFKSPIVPGMDRDKSAVAVWMDCVDDSEPVPVWQNSIIAKVTRISLSDDEDDDDFSGEGFTRGETNVSVATGISSAPNIVPEPLSIPAVNSSADSLLGAFDEPLAPAPTVGSLASSAHSSTNNLLDVDNHPLATSSSGSLLDMDHLSSAGRYRSSGANTPTSEHHDLLNMVSGPAPTQLGPTPPAQGGTMPPQQRQQPMHQHGRPPQQMGSQYPTPMQYQPQGQYAAQGMSHLPAPQQQRNMQNGASVNKNGNQNAFDKFSGSSLDPLGGLNWSMK